MHYKQAVVLARFSMVQKCHACALKWCVLGGDRHFPRFFRRSSVFCLKRAAMRPFSFLA
jgi:hypothetical protein